MNRTNILLASDKNYLPYLETALKSLLAHHNDLNVFVFNQGDIPESWVGGLQGFFAKRRSKLTLAYLPPEYLSQFSANGYISPSTYLRYYIEDLFPYADNPNWIYLDCDLVANGDITQPFAEQQPAALMAVSDPFVAALPEHPFRKGRYFNAGVLYIRADYWQPCKHELVALTAELKNELAFGDQDVLNRYFRNRWTELDAGYNFQLDHILKCGADSITPPPRQNFTLHRTAQTLVVIRFYGRTLRGRPVPHVSFARLGNHYRPSHRIV